MAQKATPVFQETTNYSSFSTPRGNTRVSHGQRVPSARLGPMLTLGYSPRYEDFDMSDWRKKPSNDVTRSNLG
jgi:hypothetical protein